MLIYFIFWVEFFSRIYYVFTLYRSVTYISRCWGKNYCLFEKYFAISVLNWLVGLGTGPRRLEDNGGDIELYNLACNILAPPASSHSQVQLHLHLHLQTDEVPGGELRVHTWG